MNPSFPNIAITPIAPKDNVVAPNLPFTPEVVNYGYPSTGEVERPLSLIDELNAKANAIPIDKNISPVYKTEGMDLSGRFPKVYLEGLVALTFCPKRPKIPSLVTDFRDSRFFLSFLARCFHMSNFFHMIFLHSVFMGA